MNSFMNRNGLTHYDTANFFVLTLSSFFRYANSCSVILCYLLLGSLFVYPSHSFGKFNDKSAGKSMGSSNVQSIAASNFSSKKSKKKKNTERLKKTKLDFTQDQAKPQESQAPLNHSVPFVESKKLKKSNNSQTKSDKVNAESDSESKSGQGEPDLKETSNQSKDKKNNKRKEAEDAITDVNLRRAIKGVDDLTQPWGIRLYFRSLTDLADPSDRKLYTNSLGAYYEYTFKNGLTLYGGTGVRYFAVDNKVRNDNNDRPQLDDITLGAAGPIFDRSRIDMPLTGSLNLTLPTSEEAKFEGYTGIVSASVNTFYSFWRISLIPTLYGNYIFNRFDKSPQYGTVNSDFSYGADLRASLRLGAGFNFSLRAGSAFTHFIDQVYTSNFTNGMGVGYSSPTGQVIVNLSLSNGSYQDQSSEALWFIDRYRRNLSLSLSYLFN